MYSHLVFLGYVISTEEDSSGRSYSSMVTSPSWLPIFQKHMKSKNVCQQIKGIECMIESVFHWLLLVTVANNLFTEMRCRERTQRIWMLHMTSVSYSASELPSSVMLCANALVYTFFEICVGVEYAVALQTDII